MTSGVKLQLKGRRFGRLLVIEQAPSRRAPSGVLKSYWTCQCDCGNVTMVWSSGLNNGLTKSCGCLARESTGLRSRTHGKTHSPEHQSWRGMKERCSNPNSNHYHIYGKEGITYDPRWEDFEVFLADMGPRPEGCTLDRFPDQAGNYGPGNCRWTTPAKQARNTRRNVNITWRGEKLCLKDWAFRLGITGGALAYRLRNWGLERAMTEVSTSAHRQSRLRQAEEAGVEVVRY